MSTFKKGDRVVFIGSDFETLFENDFKEGEILVINGFVHHKGKTSLLFERKGVFSYPSTWFVSVEEYKFNKLMETHQKLTELKNLSKELEKHFNHVYIGIYNHSSATEDVTFPLVTHYLSVDNKQFLGDIDYILKKAKSLVEWVNDE